MPSADGVSMLHEVSTKPVNVLRFNQGHPLSMCNKSKGYEHGAVSGGGFSGNRCDAGGVGG